jgi:hypothetical protein
MNVAELGTRYSVAGGIAKCAVCEKELGRGEVKIVLPSSAFLTGSMPVERRLSCASCYKALLIRTKVARRKQPALRHKTMQTTRTTKHTAGRSLSIDITSTHIY